MSRYHIFPRLIPKGVCYEIRTVQDAPIHYFKDETAISNVLEVLWRPWYRRLWFQPWLSWELDATATQIRYLVWLPNEEIGEQFKTKYYNEHPEVEISQIQDELLDLDRPHAGTKMLLKHHFVFPLKTYHNDVVDSQAELIGLMDGLKESDHVRFQFLLKPQYLLNGSFKRAFKRLHKKVIRNESQKTVVEMRETAIMGKKARRLGRVNMKAMAWSDSPFRAKELIARCRHSFGQFSSGELNRLYGREWWAIIRSLFRFEFKNRLFSVQLPWKRMVLSSEELAMFFRLPSGKVTCNKLLRMKMRRVPLPLEVLQLNGREDIKLLPIGVHEYHGQQNPVCFDLRGFNRHMAIWGGTMMGKSTFIYNLIEQMVMLRELNEFTFRLRNQASEEGTASMGFTIIDPHGSLAVDVASRIPKSQQHLVRYVRFKDGQFPFNVYDVDFSASPDKIAQNVADVCRRVWKDFWGPNVDDNFLNGGIALQHIHEATLANLRALLEEEDYRKIVLSRLNMQDPLQKQLHVFLAKYDDLPERVKEPKINSTLNKLRKITLSGSLGSMLRAATNGIRWREGMDKGYYHIFDLSGLTIDERRFAGSMCLTFTQLAMLSREDALSQGRPMPMHPVFVDEAPTFMEQSADAIQSFADEARKYNVPLILGMQGLEGQIPEQVASAIFRNFGTLIAYRVGNTEDAVTICKGMNSPLLDEEDFQRVEPNYAYMRMAIERETTLPFLVKMNPPGEALYAEDIPQMVKSTLDMALKIEEQLQAERVAQLEAEQRERAAAMAAFQEDESEVKGSSEEEATNDLSAFMD